LEPQKHANTTRVERGGLELVKGGGVVVGFSRAVCAASGSVGCWDSVGWLDSSEQAVGVVVGEGSSGWIVVVGKVVEVYYYWWRIVVVGDSSL